MGWRSTAATGSPAPTAAPGSSASSTPSTRPTTAPAVRPAAACSPTARSRGCSGATGRGRWRSRRGEGRPAIAAPGRTSGLSHLDVALTDDDDGQDGLLEGRHHGLPDVERVEEQRGERQTRHEGRQQTVFDQAFAPLVTDETKD